MKILSPFASRTRAGMFLIALALVGGTGCVTSMIVDRKPLSYREKRAQEEAYQRRIDTLTQAAASGDPAAEAALADALMDWSPSGQHDTARILALLSRSAEQGYVPARAMLGETLATGRFRYFQNNDAMPPGAQDPERGLQLLREAASQACRINFPTASAERGWIHPAEMLSWILEGKRRIGESRLWQARSILHCGRPETNLLLTWSTATHFTTQERTATLAMLLLTGDSERIAKAEASLPADAVAAARRDAEELRRQVAQSVRQYPAPSQKVL